MSADPSAGGQAAALQGDIVATAQQLHRLAVATEGAASRVAVAGDALAATETTLQSVRAQLVTATAAARAIAVQAYMDGSDSGAGFTGMWGSADTAAASQEYRALASNVESGVLDDYRRDQQLLAHQLTAAAAERSVAAKAQQAVDDQYAALERAAASEQAMLTQVQKQLQQAQVAAAARVAAQGAAAQQTPAIVQAPTTTAPAGPPATVAVSTLAPAPNGGSPAGGGGSPAGAPGSPGGAGSSPGGSGASLTQQMAELRQCESGDDYQEDSGNGYYGAYQFSPATWQGLGYSGLPSQAPPATQDQAALTLHAQQGWSPWPVCSALLGLH